MRCPEQLKLEGYAIDGVEDPDIVQHLRLCERCHWKAIEPREWILVLRAAEDRQKKPDLGLARACDLRAQPDFEGATV